MTPDQLKSIFDGNAILIMFAWGLLCKYLPFLAKIPNATIPWVNAIAYIVARFALPSDAHAGGFGDVMSHVGIVVGAFVNSVWARQLYEGFGRGLLEGWFGMRKAGAR